MGFRMRKSIKVAPGVRLNVSKSGVGASVGGRGARYSAHSSGRRTMTAGSGVVPGVYYQESAGGGRSRGSSRRSTTTQSQAAPAAPRKPGLFAPKGEKQLYKAIKAQDVQAIGRVGEEHSDFRLASYSLAGLMLLNDDSETAKRLLGEAFAIGEDPAGDSFISKYLSTRLELPIAHGVSAELPINRDAVGLALAELKQDDGDIEGAIDVVEQLEPTTYAAVSLAELGPHTAATLGPCLAAAPMRGVGSRLPGFLKNLRRGIGSRLYVTGGSRGVRALLVGDPLQLSVGTSVEKRRELAALQSHWRPRSISPVASENKSLTTSRAPLTAFLGTS